MKNSTIQFIFYLASFLLLFLLFACDTKKYEEINIGFIGPLSVRATDLGIDPSNAMLLAVEEYNSNRSSTEPKVNLFIEDDKWDKENAIPAYDKLVEEYDISILFVSNTDGTIKLQDKILEDGVILVNPINNDALLSTLNQNTFKVAKATEETNGLVASRIIELGYKKVAVLQYPNDYMTLAANEVDRILKEAKVEIKLIPTEANKTNFEDILIPLKDAGYDAYVFFGYNEFGYAMKQAREIGITAPFFGSTVLLEPEYYNNSEGAIVGTEFPFFTVEDGNYTLGKEFLSDFEARFNKKPESIWPAMQAYDAMSLVLMEIKNINTSKEKDIPFDHWLREALFNINYYQGVCGNIAIKKDGASKGIYFSLYKYASEGDPIIKVK